MTDEDETMVYADESPGIRELSLAYETTVGDNVAFFDQCALNRENRRNQWAGKSSDLRKGGENAFPWKGASDQEAHVISQRIDDLVALNVNALAGSHTKAMPVKMESMPRASAVSAFAKWMRTKYIRRFDQEFERAVNHLYEKGVAVTYVGWQKKERTEKQILSLEEIAATVPEVAELIADGGYDDELAALLQQQWPKLKTAKAKKALRQLRATGEAELVVSRTSLMDSRPYVKTVSPDTEVFFPSYCSDPQEAPFIFWRKPYTIQQIEEKVTNEGWSREWADEVISNYRGVGVDEVAFKADLRDQVFERSLSARTTDLILVVHAYQRLVDPDDGSEGIYCTVFNPFYTGASGDAPAFAKRELMNGYSQYPFIVTRLNEDTDQLYDITALAEKLRGPQWQIKCEIDARTDRNSMATLPTRYGPNGRPPAEWGPGRYVGVRRGKDEYGYFDPPRYDPGSERMEETMHRLADRIAGLDPENPLTRVRQQFGVNKALNHACEVLALAYTCFQRFGPDEIYFNVTGTPDPITIKNIEDDEFQFNITFDTLATDPETMEARAKMMASLMQMDPMGRIDKGRFIEFLAYSIDPAFASHILLPQEENQQKLAKAITDDFTKLWSGIEIGPQPNGGMVAMQMGQAWMQQGDVAQRLQGDEAFKARVEKYFDQVQFQLQQAQNAVIGRIGTVPAEFQGTNTAA